MNFPILLMILASICYVSGGVFMKTSDGLTRLWPSILVFVTFCAGAALQTIAMRKTGLGTAYVFVLGLEAVLAFVLGLIIFRESANMVKVAAVALIVLGIVMLKGAD
ncbi:MAG: hypothetical protein K1X53_13120 [Candidatus Sumerlaeaceae bacterium]|nr:hypothetical protein [Candidatus Sumerlaeaceae bacterium]